jgi:hypothetical protein
MLREVTHELPPAVARNLAACNGHDIDAWMATFDPDALVNDVQREFAGAEAIRAFAAKEIFGDRVTFTPLQAFDRPATSPSARAPTGPMAKPACPTR